MDPSEWIYLDEKDGPMKMAMKHSVSGFVGGAVYGWAVARFNNIPRGERTLKMMRSKGLTFAGLGGVSIGVQQLVQNYRGKKDSYNVAIGGFVAGASVYGLQARSVPSAITSGTALAIISVLFDSWWPERHSRHRHRREKRTEAQVSYER